MVRLMIRVPTAGRYGVWVGGNFARGVEVGIDARRVGAVRYELGFAEQQLQAGQTTLAAGDHVLWLRYPRGDLHPGSGLEGLALGPVSLVPVTPLAALAPAAADQVPSLCSRPLDWLEVVRPVDSRPAIGGAYSG